MVIMMLRALRPGLGRLLGAHEDIIGDYDIDDDDHHCDIENLVIMTILKL